MQLPCIDLKGKKRVKKESEEGGYTRDKEGPKRGRRSIVN